MEIRRMIEADQKQIQDFLERIDTFSKEEVKLAMELAHASLQPGHTDYRVLVAVREPRVVGFVCFGPTPLTQGTFDLYWVATEPELRGQGIGSALVAAMEAELRRQQVRIVRVETSAVEAYGPTRSFYANLQYREEGRIVGFYRPGEDLIVLTKHFDA